MSSVSFQTGRGRPEKQDRADGVTLPGALQAWSGEIRIPAAPPRSLRGFVDTARLSGLDADG